MAVPKLFVSPGSASCRRVLLTLKALGDAAPEVETVHVDLSKGDHKTDEFLALNPLHCVPTIKTLAGNGGWESRAIMRHLVLLAGGHHIYPAVPDERLAIDRLLDWDLGRGYKAIAALVYPQIFAREDQKISSEFIANRQEDVREALHFLDRHQLQDGRLYLIGGGLSLADLCIAANLTMLELVGFEIADCPRLTAWQKRMTELPYWAEVNAPFEAWKASLQTSD